MGTTPTKPINRKSNSKPTKYTSYQPSPVTKAKSKVKRITLIVYGFIRTISQAYTINPLEAIIESFIGDDLTYKGQYTWIINDKEQINHLCNTKTLIKSEPFELATMRWQLQLEHDIRTTFGRKESLRASLVKLGSGPQIPNCSWFIMYKKISSTELEGSYGDFVFWDNVLSTGWLFTPLSLQQLKRLTPNKLSITVDIKITEANSPTGETLYRQPFYYKGPFPKQTFEWSIQGKLKQQIQLYHDRIFLSEIFHNMWYLGIDPTNGYPELMLGFGISDTVAPITVKWTISCEEMDFNNSTQTTIRPAAGVIWSGFWRETDKKWWHFEKWDSITVHVDMEILHYDPINELINTRSETITDTSNGSPTEKIRSTEKIISTQKMISTENTISKQEQQSENLITKLAGGNKKSTGVCKRFNSAKGFGFISCDDGSGDVFVHQTEIYADGFRSLQEGEQIEFNVVVQDDGRRKAIDVTGPNGAFVKGLTFKGDSRRGAIYNNRGGYRGGRYRGGGHRGRGGVQGGYRTYKNW
eukprot:188652_1